MQLLFVFLIEVWLVLTGCDGEKEILIVSCYYNYGKITVMQEPG
jgi:hypothetical protein